MIRELSAAVGLLLATSTLAQAPHRRSDGPAQGAPSAAASAAPAATPAEPVASSAAPAAAPAPKGPKGLDEARKLGRQGLVKIAPRLGGSRVERLARDKGGVVVDKAVDLAAEKAGVKK